MRDGSSGKRSAKEDAALAALLSEKTIAEAAAKADVSPATLYRWLEDPRFKTRYREARRSVVESAIGRLQQGVAGAVDTLSRNLACGTPASEIAAAKAMIDYAIKAVELVDLAERVEALEAASEAVAEREHRR